MRLYHKIFLILKIIIIGLLIISRFNIIHNSELLETIFDDTLSIFVGIMIIYIFWPWLNRYKYNIDFHDKMLIVSAGGFLLISKNYKVFSKNINSYRKSLLN